MNLEPLDQLWLLICACLVLTMQAGFLCLETGLTRSKNAITVALKNVVDLAITPLVFIPLGAALMFGPSIAGWVGDSQWSPDASSGWCTFLVFQVAFCATATTIVSGATAERMRFSAYVATCVLLSALIYPIIGHWAWGGAWTGTPGWLQALGFEDFAGSGVVHMTGGCAALAAVLAIGPRLGRFDDQRSREDFLFSNLPLAMLGGSLMVVGWLGFNAGSTLQFNDQVPLILLNTLLSACGGGAVAMAVVGRFNRSLGPDAVINGMMGGLVASCAVVDVCQPLYAALVGGIAGVVSLAFTLALTRFRIDDAVSAFPVHGACGAVGLLARPLVNDTPPADLLGAVAVQALGALSIGAAAFVPTYLFVGVAMPKAWRRVTAESEQTGPNQSDHGVVSELQSLLSILSTKDQPSDGSGQESLSGTAHDAVTLTQELKTRLTQVNEEREKQLREYSQFLHTVLDGIDTHVCILDASGVIVATNAAWVTFLEAADAPSEGAIGTSFPTLCMSSGIYRAEAANELSAAATSIAAGRSTGFRGEFIMNVGDQERTLDVTLKRLPEGGRGAVLIMQADRTDERNAQRLTQYEKERAEHSPAP